MSTTLDIFLTSTPNGRERSNSYIKCFTAKEILRGILWRICRLGPRAGLYTNKSHPPAGNGSAHSQTQKYLCHPGSHRFDMMSFNSTQTYSKDKAIKYGLGHKIEKDKWKGMEVK